MNLNQYKLEHQDAMTEHRRILESAPNPYSGEAREKHVAHLKRAHARLMKATAALNAAQAKLNQLFGDCELDECGGAA